MVFIIARFQETHITYTWNITSFLRMSTETIPKLIVPNSFRCNEDLNFFFVLFDLEVRFQKDWFSHWVRTRNNQMNSSETLQDNLHPEIYKLEVFWYLSFSNSEQRNKNFAFDYLRIYLRAPRNYNIFITPAHKNSSFWKVK